MLVTLLLIDRASECGENALLRMRIRIVCLSPVKTANRSGFDARQLFVVVVRFVFIDKLSKSSTSKSADFADK
jgi:hypothetical protein